MKTLVVAPQPFFSPRGTPFSVYYRTLVMAEHGLSIDLLTYGEGQDVEIPGVRIVRIPRLRFLGPVPIGPSPTKALLDVVLGIYMIGMLLVNRYELVHAHEEAVFPMAILKRIFGFRLVYDMHSSLPQQLTNFKFTTSRSLIGAFTWLERMSLRSSDAVITICPALAKYALSELDDPSKHFLIENSIFEPVRLSSASRANALDAEPPDATPEAPSGSPRVVYAGTLEPYQGIELLLEAFGQARRELPDASLLIVGGTPEQVSLYEARARALGLDGAARFIGRVAPQVARTLAANADLLVSPRIDGTNTPLKIYEQLASGVPLVATNIFSHTQVLTEEVAFLADPDANAFGKALVQAATDPGAREEKVQCAQALYDAAYSRSAYVSKIAALLARIA